VRAAAIPLILDVDTGIDDSLALLYACASPEADLLAVTCSAGNVDARRVARNTLAVLELAGRSDVEVALGRETPLERDLVTTPETHGPDGIGWAELPMPRAALSPRSSPDLIVEEARRRPGEIVLVALAPLTNVALAVRREPDLPRLLKRLVIMGGAYRAPGNTTPVSEWNVHVDPEAARAVFSAWTSAVERDAGVVLPLALGLDVTERAKLLPAHLARLGAAAGSDGAALEARVRSADAPPPGNRVLRFAADALRFYMEFHALYDGFYGAFVHDPFVVAVALDEALARSVPLAVDVELTGEITTGQTVADWRGLWGRKANADVAVEGDGPVFLERLIERLGALAARVG
jgi:purine nucleosidase